MDHPVKIETLQDIFGKPVGDGIWNWILRRWYPTEAEWRSFDIMTDEILERLRRSGYVTDPAQLPPDPKIYFGLSVRSKSALKSLGLRSRGQIKHAIKIGWLAPGKIRNYGHKSHAEICSVILGNKQRETTP